MKKRKRLGGGWMDHDDDDEDGKSCCWFTRVPILLSLYIYMRLSVSFLARDATVIYIYSLLFLYFGNMYSHKYTSVICGG